MTTDSNVPNKLQSDVKYESGFTDILASYTSQDIVSLLEPLEGMCSRDGEALPCFNAAIAYFKSDAELVSLREDAAQLNYLEGLVRDCAAKLNEWTNQGENSLQAILERKIEQRRQLWLALKGGDSVVPEPAIAGFKSPYETDYDQLAFHVKYYTLDEANAVVTQITEILVSGDSSLIKSKMKDYATKWAKNTAELKDLKDKAAKKDGWKQYLKLNKPQHEEFLRMENKLAQVEKDIKELSSK
jgi:hypothetical protein